MIKVGFDDQIFIAQSRGGISKYFVEIIKRLPQYGIDPVVLSLETRNAHLAESGLVPTAKSLSPTMSRILGVWWRATGRPRYRGPLVESVDLIHHTFTHRAYLGLGGKPSVVTIYDMIPEVYPEYFPSGNPHFAKEQYAKHCDVLVTISNSTTTDMLKFYGKELESKTVVVPFGVGEQFLEPKIDVSMPELPEKYLLFVGIRRGYKQFITAFKAFEELAEGDPNLHLVIVGGGRYSDEESKLIQASSFENRVSHFNPTDDQMPHFYKKAHCFLFPSVYEGFGLPTLEALAAGTPVVLADASCSKEVGGEVVVYCTPGDVGSLVEGVNKATTSEWKKMTLVEGPKRAREFTWDVAARMTAEVYKKLASSTR